MEGDSQFGDTKFLAELMAEKDSIDPSFVHAVDLLTKRIDEVKNPNGKKPEASKQKQFFDMTDENFPKVECNMKLPTDKFPNFNFIGKILGPGGSTLQAIQDLTNTRIAILGKGSVRDRKKVEEHLASKDPKWDHLNQPLHVRISSISRLDQAYLNIGNACSEIVKVIKADLEEFGVKQQRGKTMTSQRGRGRGAQSSNGRGMSRGGRGSSSQPQRDGGRGGNRGTGRGGGNRGTGAASRGNRGFRGGMGARGNNRGSMRGAAQPHYMPAVNSMESYASEMYDQAQTELYDDQTYAEYGDQSLNAYEGYDPYSEEYVDQNSYSAFSYGEGVYDSYGNGSQQTQQLAQYGMSKPFRGKMPGRGGAMRGRGGGKPY